MRKVTRKATLLIGLACAGVATTAYAATILTLTTPGCNTPTSSGVHKCNVGADRDSDGNDPRSESFVVEGVDPDNPNDYFRFDASYYITEARRTTILQFLNDAGSGSSDRYKPVVFLTATRIGSTNNYFICNGNSTSSSSCSGASWSSVPAGFRLTAERNGTNVNVTINGSRRTLSLVTTPSGQNRSTGETDLRFGVYQHDLNSNGSTVAAQVRVYNRNYNSFN